MRARPSKAPAEPLELYSFESSPFSKRVRARLCELAWVTQARKAIGSVIKRDREVWRRAAVDPKLYLVDGQASEPPPGGHVPSQHCAHDGGHG